MLYVLALNTGLRAKEIASLSIESFDFITKTLTVEASNTKNRQVAVLPLSEYVCNAVQEWFPKRGGLAKAPTSSLLFAGTWVRQRIAGKMLQRDLKRSTITHHASRTASNGSVLDFHSFRYTFISNLAKTNVHRAKAQRLARHSDINLTMSLYTSLELSDLRDAVDGLPQFG